MIQQVYDFDEIKDATREAVRQIFPVTEGGYVIDVEGVDIKDPRAGSDDLSKQYSAVIGGKSWSVPVRAHLVMRGPAGTEKRTVTLARIPRLTQRQTFIVNGKEYQLNSTLRRKAGVFTFRNQRGDLVTEFNLVKNGLHSGGAKRGVSTA